MAGLPVAARQRLRMPEPPHRREQAPAVDDRRAADAELGRQDRPPPRRSTNSGSMADRQAILATAIPDLVQGPSTRAASTRTARWRPRSPRPTRPVRRTTSVSSSRSRTSTSASSARASAATGRAPARDGERLETWTWRTSSRAGARPPRQRHPDLPQPGLTWPGTWIRKLDGEPDQLIRTTARRTSNGDSNADLNDIVVRPCCSPSRATAGGPGCGFEAQLDERVPLPRRPEALRDDQRSTRRQPKTSSSPARDAAVKRSAPTSCGRALLRDHHAHRRERLLDPREAELPRGRRPGRSIPPMAAARRVRHRSGQQMLQVVQPEAGRAAPRTTAHGPRTQRRQADRRGGSGQLAADQKRRFGFDFLYPIDRYRRAFTEAQIPNRRGELVPNPIFSDPNPDDLDSSVRDPGARLLRRYRRRAVAGHRASERARPA